MTVLDTILAATRERLERCKAEASESALRQAALRAPPPRRLAPALRAEAPVPRVIAELKRASPSRGTLRDPFEPGALAGVLEAAGAAALSVLTEPAFFQGSGAFLREAVRATALPVLRKDFVVDRYQLYEARAWGAGAVLLIAAALEAVHFRDLLRWAEDLELEVLAEAHDRRELDRALEAGATIIGINSRDLRTLEIDLGRCASLLSEIPAGRLRVAESGVETRADIDALRAAGADAFLVGSSLMRAAEPGQALAELLRPSSVRNGENRS